MITFLTLNIEGYCSIGESIHLPLNIGGTVLIKAPNGSGKSSIFSALVWGLYGKNIKGVSEVNTWKEYQPKDYSGTKVEVFFQCNSDTYKIIRCQNFKKYLEDGAKGSNRLIVYCNGDVIDIKNKSDIQNYINKKLGLTYTLFMNSVMFGQGIQRLIQESNSDKKKLFEEVFDLNFLNIAKGIATDEKSDLGQQARDLEYQLNTLRKDLEKTKLTYIELRDRERAWKANIHRQRRILKEKRKELTLKLSKIQSEIKDEVDMTLDTKISKQVNRLSDIKKELSEAKSLSRVPLEEFIDEVLELMNNKKYKSAYSKLKIIKKAFLDIEDLTEKLSSAQDRLISLKEIKARYTSIKDTCNNLADHIVDVDNDLSKLKEEKLQILSPKYKSEISQLKDKLRKADEDYHNKLSEIEDYEWLIDDPLGNKGIKAYLFDSSLHLLNRVLEEYSKVLGFHIEFNIDLNSTRKDFVTLIERDGHIIDYDELSGGEKQLCDISMAFAMNEALTASRGINISFLDEVFESLSQDNIEIVLSLIRHIYKNKTLFLITHHESLPLPNSHTLQVQKINGLTHIKPL